MSELFLTPLKPYILLQALLCFLLFHNNCSVPVKSSISYNEFLEDIKLKNCTFPSYVKLPLEPSDTFEYLAVPLKICTSPESTNRIKEANILCNDVFRILRNITCLTDKNVELPNITVEFSEDVCPSIITLQFPSDEKSILKHLTDRLVCEMMCDNDFKSACQVLLWSYQIQQLINNEPKVKKIEAVFSDHKTGEISSDHKTKEAGKIFNDYNIKSNITDTNLLKEPLTAKTVPVNNKASSNKESTLATTTKGLNKVILTKDINTAKIQETVLSNIEVKEENKTATKNAEQLNVTGEVRKMENDKLVQSNIGDMKNVKPVQNSENPKGTQRNSTLNVVANQNSEKTESLLEVNVEDSKIKPEVEIPENKEQPKEPEKKIELTTASKVAAANADESNLDEPNLEESNLENAKNADDLKILEKVNDNQEISLITTIADLEKMEDENEIPQPVDKNQDPYDDMENESEYSKLDYDGDDSNLYDPSKNKKNNEEKPPQPPVHQNEMVFKPRNSIGSEIDEIQMVPAFPEQEDSHFFFYFLTIVFLLMGGYLIFHNKQKIIALIVEGRHERRRRSHGVGYKKLETK